METNEQLFKDFVKIQHRAMAMRRRAMVEAFGGPENEGRGRCGHGEGHHGPEGGCCRDGEGHGNDGRHGEGCGHGHDHHDQGCGHGRGPEGGHGPHAHGPMGGHGPHGAPVAGHGPMGGHGPQGAPVAGHGPMGGHGPQGHGPYGTPMPPRGPHGPMGGHGSHGRPPMMDPMRGQGRILSLLLVGDGVTTREMATILDIRPSSLNESLGRLEERGYIVRSKDEQDGRKVRVTITEEGRAVADSLRDASPADIFDCLTQEEKDELGRILAKVAASLRPERNAEQREGADGAQDDAEDGQE